MALQVATSSAGLLSENLAIFATGKVIMYDAPPRATTWTLLLYSYPGSNLVVRV